MADLTLRSPVKCLALQFFSPTQNSFLVFYSFSSVAWALPKHRGKIWGWFFFLSLVYWFIGLEIGGGGFAITSMVDLSLSSSLPCRQGWHLAGNFIKLMLVFFSLALLLQIFGF